MSRAGSDGFTRKRVGAVWWRLAPGMDEALLPILEDLGKRREYHPALGEIGTSSVKSVRRIKANRPGLAGELTVKTYSESSPFSTLTGTAAASAEKEWEMAREHSRRGLPAPSHLAMGKRKGKWGAREYILILESPTSHERFDDFFRTTFRPELPSARPMDKRRVISDLAGLLRRMHDRGISRPKIEPGNILAAPRSGGGVHFIFVDLGQSLVRRSKKGISVEERTLELARFHKSFSPLFSQGYRIRFYREYFSPDNLSSREFRELVKKIVDLSARLAIRDEPGVEKKVRQRVDPYFWFVTRDHRVFLRKPVYQNSIIESLDKLEAAENRVRIRIKMIRDANMIEVMARKLSPPPDRARGVAGAAEWAFIMSAIMEHHGVSHYRVMAAIEPKGDQGGITLEIPPGRGEYNLAEYLARKVAEEFSGAPWDRRFLIRVASFLLNLHNLGWRFPQPSGDDLWVRYTEEGTHEIRLSNLQRMRRFNPSDAEERLRNLLALRLALPISQSDGIVLAEEYLRFSRAHSSDRPGWRKRFLEWQLGSASAT